MRPSLSKKLLILLCIFAMVSYGVYQVVLWNTVPPLPPQEECAFCQQAVLEYQKFYEDELVLALYSHKPTLPGHALIIPKRHVERFELLSDEEALALTRVIKKVHTASMQVFGNISYLIYQKNGREVGQTVPHLHIHYIPRKVGDTSMFSFLYKLGTSGMQKPISSVEMQAATQQMQLAMAVAL